MFVRGIPENCQPRAAIKELAMETNVRTKWAVRWIAVLMMFSLAWFGACAQTTSATLSGSVHDSTGAVVPQVKITLKSAAQGVSRATTTDGDGRYNFSAVDPGTYELRAERTGFNTEVKSGVVLTVGGSSQTDLTLKIGQ